jgi:hypothetical protein
MRTLPIIGCLLLSLAACAAPSTPPLFPIPTALAPQLSPPTLVPTLAPPSPTPTVAITPSSPATAAPPAPTLSSAPALLPIFDTHAHYSRNAWSEHSPQEIINKLVNSNVVRALVSSSPDEGTRRLYALDPVRILPGLRPYHDDVTTTNWETSEKTLPYLDERIGSPMYVALGEIHVHVQNIESPILQGAIQRALKRNLVLHIHSDAESLRAVLRVAPQARILWAHAGLSEAPATVSALLDEFPNVWTDISIREYAIAPNGTLADEWRALFLKHPDRITIGTDTWIPERWTAYEQIIARDRVWLDQLPRDVAEKIAFRNAVTLFGAGDVPALQK